MPVIQADSQIAFLLRIQRLLDEGLFVATYKYALLQALADISVERGDDTGAPLEISSSALAEKFIEYYWQQAAPYQWEAQPGESRILLQNTGKQAAVLNDIVRARRDYSGSLTTLRRDKTMWRNLRTKVAQTIRIMPLRKLQTVGKKERLDFLYPDEPGSSTIRVNGDAVFCFRRFHGLVTNLVQGAWARFVRQLPQNEPLVGRSQELREFLFGSQRASLTRVYDVLCEVQTDCFYCGHRLPDRAVVDHFVPWTRYTTDLGHNFVLADAGCNAGKSDRLAATEHLKRWCQRNHVDGADLAIEFDRKNVWHDVERSLSVARWVYGQAETVSAKLWLRGRDELSDLEGDWRRSFEE